MYQTLIKNGKKRTLTKEKNRNIIEADEGQEYGIVRELLGNGRLNVLCEDNVIRMGRIRGSMRHYSKKILIEKGDLILISKRDFEEGKIDVCHKYNYDETCKLTGYKDFPKNIVKAWKSFDQKVEEEEHNEYLVFAEDEIKENQEEGINKKTGENHKGNYMDDVFDLEEL